MDIDMEIEQAEVKMDADGDVDMESATAAHAEIVPVPTEEAVRHKQELQEEQAPQVWGLSRRYLDGEEIRPNIRLLDLENVCVAYLTTANGTATQGGRGTQYARRPEPRPFPLDARYQ
jgi:hypothetical protein